MRKIALFTLALLACQTPPSTDDERDRVIADVAASREAVRQSMPTQQAAFSLPCPASICRPDIQTADVMECGAWYPSSYKICVGHSSGGLECTESEYENMVVPTSGMVRFFFKSGGGANGVCFEIDTYVGSGRRGVPQLAGFYFNGVGYNTGDASNVVRMRTGILHASGGVWEHYDYNAHTAGASSGQGVNEEHYHSIGSPGWISSVAAFYEP